MGRALGDAIAESDRKVILVASGALSHTFWPLRELRKHEAAGVEHIFSPEAAAADAERIAWFAAGDHARVLETMPEFYRFKPEARFGHYLMMIGAIGEGDCTAAGAPVRRVRELGRHRAGPPVVRPARRTASRSPHRTAARRGSPLTERRRILLDGATVDVVRDGDVLRAGDGRAVAIDDAVHLPPVVPSKIIAVHLTYSQPGRGVRHVGCRTRRPTSTSRRRR